MPMRFKLESSGPALTLTLTLTLTLFASIVHADLWTSIADSACATFVSGLSTGECYDEFTRNYKEFRKEDKDVPQYVVCCGISILQSCLEDKVQEKCGESAKGISKSLVSTFAKTSNELAGKPLECDWNAWYYDDRKSPVCWPMWGQIVGGVGVLLIFLFCCGGCCCAICCRRRGK